MEKRYCWYYEKYYSLLSQIICFISINYLFLRKHYNMKEVTYTQKTMVVNNPSKALVELMDKLRERKRTQQEKLRNKKNCSIKIEVA